MRRCFFISILLLLLPLTSYGQKWHDLDSLQELTPEQADSLFFRFSHHYSVNFNFRITADSLVLIPKESDFVDTCIVLKDELLVVADISRSGQDSIWVKLYRDQITMGWVSERQLLESAIPDDIISEIIYFFENNEFLRYLILAVLLLIGVLMFKVNRLYSVIYILFTLGLAASLWYVINTQHDYWLEFYYHPTLNPFVLPDEMKIVLGMFWLECITSIALIFVVSDYFSRQVT